MGLRKPQPRQNGIRPTLGRLLVALGETDGAVPGVYKAAGSEGIGRCSPGSQLRLAPFVLHLVQQRSLFTTVKALHLLFPRLSLFTIQYNSMALLLFFSISLFSLNCLVLFLSACCPSALLSGRQPELAEPRKSSRLGNFGRSGADLSALCVADSREPHQKSNIYSRELLSPLLLNASIRRSVIFPPF